MPKKKVRFTIRVGEQESELFSVRETAKFDLIVLMKLSEQQFDQWSKDELKDVVEARLTVHASPNSPGVTINYHGAFADQGSRGASTFILPRHNRLVWPLLAHMTSSLAPERYAARPNGHDLVRSLGEYSPQFRTLIYHIVLADKDSLPDVEGFNRAHHDFEKFRVCVFWTFSYLPSFHQGKFVILSTTEVSIDAVRGEILTHDARSPMLRKFRRFLPQISQALATDVASLAVKWLATYDDFDPSAVQSIEMLSRMFSKNPATQ